MGLLADYSYLQLPLLAGDHVLYADSGFIAYLYGVPVPNGPESYALSLGFDAKIPAIQTSSSATICLGESANLTADGAWSYNWIPLLGTSSNSTSSLVVHPAMTTTYTLNAINICGLYQQTITVKVNPLPQIDAGADLFIKEGDSAELNPIVFNALDFLWSPVSSLSCNTCKNPIVNPINTCIYFLSLTDSFHCKNNDSVKVIVIPKETLYIPNSFTSNDDNNNDIFYVYGNRIKSIDMKIFNRWGELLFNSSVDQQGWDGRYTR